MSSNEHYSDFPNLTQTNNIVKSQPFIIEIAPLRFKPTRGGTVRLDEVASVATGLAMLADEDAQRVIVAFAATLGVEVE